MFFEKFKSFILEPGFIKPDSKVLLTVSGGIDSMVMMYLFHRLQMNCSVAHCNFQLRGQESDEDESFVRQQAGLLHYQIFVSKLETVEFAAEKHISIQMAARDLRYSWFEKLAYAHQFDYIATGHNADDAIETFMLQLGRGTGIAGLTGISAKSGMIIRPLLCASRIEISQYATENNIPHREDSSNSSDKYQRNFIRHHIIPKFNQVFPNFNKSFSQTLENLGEAHQLYKEMIDYHINNISRRKEDMIYIDIPKLQNLKVPRTVLFEIIKTYGFSPAVLDDIYQSINAISGKQFVSSTHKLVKDRNFFIISEINQDQETNFYIFNNCTSIKHPCALSFEVMEQSSSMSFKVPPTIALINFDKLVFPLILRKWHFGDYFKPLGMKGMKKLSDFFIDNKLSRNTKEKQWILTSNNQIVWIVGKRLDDRFKLNENTRHVYKISMIE